MELRINDLGEVHEAVYEARTKAYDIGLKLKVPVDTLDSIEDQYRVPGDKLREVLKTWLRTAPKPTWQDILDALRSRVVGQPKLARDIEAKYKLHSTVEAAHVSRETIPEVLPQQPTSAATQPHTLQQELQTKDKQLQELTEQLLAMKQPGPLPQRTATQQQPLNMPLVRARPHETVTPPRPELRQPQEKQHAAENRKLLAMKQPGSPPQKTVVQQKAIRDMRWQKESKAPERMHRGSAAVDSNVAYFDGWSTPGLHSYDSNTQEWCRLPDAPYAYSTLVVVDHTLTAVGGKVGGTVSTRSTNSLLSLMGVGKHKKWLPDLPAMPTKRYYIAAVCSGHSLIVAGGSANGRNRLSTVEVLDTDTRQWSIASSLTHPFSLATISICGERLYMLGGYDHTGVTHSVLSCSIPELLQSCQTQPLAGKLQTASADQSAIWRQVADAPHKRSSCATLCGQLVAVGGSAGTGKWTSAISVYNETTDSWEAMGDMPTARRVALVAILNGKMMVVGGTIGGYGIDTDVVEILC